MSGLELIHEERARQVQELGYGPLHDVQHAAGELGIAAAVYIEAGRCHLLADEDDRKQLVLELGAIWPWSLESFQPSLDDPIRNLVKAGALIAAEIDRLEALL
jgi:hypothetical protein